MTMKKVKTAIVGLGFIGMSHLKGHLESPNIELRALVDVNKELGEKLSSRHNVRYYQTIDDLLQNEDVDMVDVCIPTWLHEDCIIKAAQKKKHVLCEKPLTFTLESFERIAKAVDDSNVRFMVAQVIRFWPEYVRIKELYNKGEFGPIKLASARRISEVPNWSSWYKDPNKSGGALFDLMLHDLDYFVYLFGEPKSVYAAGKQSETGCWDYVQANIRFENDINAAVESSNAAFGHFPFTMGFFLFGSDMIANYELKAGHNIDTIGKRDLFTYTESSGEVRQKVEEYDPYAFEINYFADCIINNKPCDIVSMESSRQTLKLALAVKKSLETKSPVELK